MLSFGRCFYPIWIISWNCDKPTHNQNRRVYSFISFTRRRWWWRRLLKMMKSIYKIILVFLFLALFSVFLFQMKSEIKRNNVKLCQCRISFAFMSEKTMNTEYKWFFKCGHTIELYSFIHFSLLSLKGKEEYIHEKNLQHQNRNSNDKQIASIKAFFWS